jgi:NTP pyrophosphatase (non-canonical NTP hydrolase)
MAIETLNHYQVQVLRTANEAHGRDWEKMVCGLGIAGEAGEVADLIKKEVGHGHDAKAEKVFEELGDVLWYVARLADLYGFSLSDIATYNVDKLKVRYPEGFSTERSVNREG